MVNRAVHKGGGGGWHKASVSDCLPLGAPIGLSPLLILTLCGPECVLVVSTEPLGDLSCLTAAGSALSETRQPIKGGGGQTFVTPTETGLLSASWSWDFLHFKSWRLAVGSWWLTGVGNGSWRLMAVGGG